MVLHNPSCPQPRSIILVGLLSRAGIIDSATIGSIRATLAHAVTALDNAPVYALDCEGDRSAKVGTMLAL